VGGSGPRTATNDSGVEKFWEIPGVDIQRNWKVNGCYKNIVSGRQNERRNTKDCAKIQENFPQVFRPAAAGNTVVAPTRQTDRSDTYPMKYLAEYFTLLRYSSLRSKVALRGPVGRSLGEG
jgi:hypothetical protein